MEYINFDNMIFKKTKFDGYYVSKEGFIISVKIKGGQGTKDYNAPRYHSVKKDKDGYLEVCLSISENNITTRKYKRVHRLIWETFNGEIKPKHLTIDHIDCNKQNNSINNLRLLTRSENTARSNALRVGEKRNIAKNKSFYKITLSSGEVINNIRYGDLISKYNISAYFISQVIKGNYPKTLKEKGILLERV